MALPFIGADISSRSARTSAAGRPTRRRRMATARATTSRVSPRTIVTADRGQDHERLDVVAKSGLRRLLTLGIAYEPLLIDPKGSFPN